MASDAPRFDLLDAVTTLLRPVPGITRTALAVLLSPNGLATASLAGISVGCGMILPALFFLVPSSIVFGILCFVRIRQDSRPSAPEQRPSLRE